MGRTLISLILVILLISLVSSEIIMNQQPKELYNLGDIITLPVTIKSLNDMSGVFEMNIICNGQEENFYKNGIGLSGGEEKRIESMLVLTRPVIGELKGDCKIKAMLNNEYVITNDFVITDALWVEKTSKETEFEPGKNLFVKGNAVKENGRGANGFIEMEITADNSSLITHLEIIKNGFFMINASLPENMKAGAYLVRLKAYEKDLEGLITNNGFLDFNINIRQIPNNLEIVFENEDVEPGTSLKAKTILHDQTGENIATTSSITIKDNEDKIIEQTEKQTGEFFEFPIVYNQPPSNWTLIAKSSGLESEMEFMIIAKEEVKVELINKTLIVTNRGNVPYNKSILVKVENESLHVDVYLNVDEVKKYLITAPNGEYKIEIMTDEGDKITGMATLSGRTTEIQELSEGIEAFVRRPFLWGFLILVLGAIAFLIFKKVRKKSSFGFISRITKKRGKEPITKAKDFFTNIKNKAELSLSIKGDKQDVSLICLKIKNLNELKSKRENLQDTLQRISKVTEEHKAVIYENQDSFFFILAPIKTKTFRNEPSALQTARKIKELLNNHNKLFKVKIDFGISLNYGTMIAKQDDIFKFSALGNLMTSSKKIASLSDKDIILSGKINERLSRYAKTKKKIIDKTEVYTVEEIKDTEEHKKFIRNFLDRIEGKNTK